MKTKILIVMIMAFVLQGCDLFGSGGSTGSTNTPERSPTTYSNITNVADVYVYTVPPVDATTIGQIGEFGTTNFAACYIVWNNIDSAFCGCRNTESDGQWVQTCTTDIDGIVTCPDTVSAESLLIQSTGPARDLSVPEMELCDAIKRVSYCDGVRVDGSASPCIPG